MDFRILVFISFILTLSGCSSKCPEIHTACARDEIGNYLLKWEVNPLSEGVVQVYVSDNPERFNLKNPVQTAELCDGVTRYITDDNFNRKFFCLTFNGKYPQILGANFIAMDKVKNMRDIGGIQTKNNQQVKWGKVYRSGQLTELSEWDSMRLANLGIRTILDLRTESEVAQRPIAYHQAKIIHIPIYNGNAEALGKRIWGNQIRKGDSFLYMQDVYIQYISKNTDQLAKALEVFLDEENYPIVISCPLGKDRSGMLTALLLSVLDVSKEAIVKDYLESNYHIDPGYYAQWVKDLSLDTQEAITVLLSARESFLSAALNEINKEYGSIQKYLKKELHISKKKEEELQRLLLYGDNCVPL